MRLALQAVQVPGDIVPSMARLRGQVLAEMLIQGGDFAAAEPVCAAALAACRDAGDLRACRACCPGWGCWTCGRAAPGTPRRTCAKQSRSPCGPTP